MSRTDRKKLPKPKTDDEVSYRDIDRLSYSSLKQYSTDRKKYKLLSIDKDEEAIEKDKKEKAESPYIRMGNMVDIRMTDPEEFDNIFVVTESTPPTGQMLIFTDFLYDVTIRDSVEGVIETELSDRMAEAYELLKDQNGGKLQAGFPKFVERFQVEANEYFRDKLRSTGKTIISRKEEQVSSSIVDSLVCSKSLSRIVNHPDKIIKFPVMFNVGDLEFKMELDQGNFDHENKILYPFDYKITSFIEDFIWSGYLGNKYYIQSGLYKFGLEQWIASVPEYKDYRVENMSFIVADYNNYYAPLLYQTGDAHYEQSWLGFTVGNKRYKGIHEIIGDLELTLKTDNWAMSPENIRKNGLIQIPKFTDLEV